MLRPAMPELALAADDVLDLSDALSGFRCSVRELFEQPTTTLTRRGLVRPASPSHCSVLRQRLGLFEIRRDVAQVHARGDRHFILEPDVERIA